LKIQSTPRTSPSSFTTKVGPASRIQESSLDISTTRTCSGSWLRALSYCRAETATVTASVSAIAVATAVNAACAGLPPRRQLSGRSGQTSQQPAWWAHSAGMR
jgi:ApbE superfamily uncharacterized protein (UPF0280 family)